MVTAPTESQPDLHIITTLDWVREGAQTFDQQRVQLLDMLSRIMESLQTPPKEYPNQHFLLAGQTILLDDINQLRIPLTASLMIYHAGGKVAFGPWYTPVDGLLTEGETFVRNLLMAREDAKRYGVKLMSVAYLPDSCQHTPQLPQILRGFGIDAAFLCGDNPSTPLPFRWDAPDGSSILVLNYQRRESPQLAVNSQRQSQPDGPFLWIHPVTPDALFPTNTGKLPILPSNLEKYADDVRDKLPDNLRPALKGELHLQKDSAISGRFSARIALKQETNHLYTQLTDIAEPLTTLALNFGTRKHVDVQKAILSESWRFILQNQTRQTISGAVSDDVTDDVRLRNRRVAENSDYLIQQSFASLTGKPVHSATAVEETYLVVWNLHGHRVEQVVEIALQLPAGKYPAVLTSPTGEEQPFSWYPTEQKIGFRADVPSVGYATYTLRLSKEVTANYNQPRTSAGRSIGSASSESLGLGNGEIDWRFEQGIINHLLSYFDGGDAGDCLRYQVPQTDLIVQDTISDAISVEATPTYERLTYKSRLRVAGALKDGNIRERGLRNMDLSTSITYYNELQGIHFRTSFENIAEDHRLRAHIRTGIQADGMFAGSAFGMVKRSIPASGDAGTQPLQGTIAIHGKEYGLGLFTRGLSEVEPIREDDQVTLALTLLRSVGWLDKSKQVKAPKAQQIGDVSAEFMLMLLPQEYDPAMMIRTAKAYRAPLRATQTNQKPDQVTQSYFQLDQDRVVMTALKPPQDGEGVILRLMNTSHHDTGVHVKSVKTPQQAIRTNLAEENQSECTIEKNQVNLSLQPNQVATLRLVF